MKQNISFPNSFPEFTKALKSNIDHYFSDNNLHRTGNWHLFHKGLVLFLTGILLYVAILSGAVALWAKLVCYVLLGIDFALIGFNVMHDAGHGSYSRHPWMNRVMSCSLNIMGGSMLLWKIKHNVLHHTFTNIEGEDDDIDIKPFIRTNQFQKHYALHRFQQYYFFMFYSLTYVAWIWYRDFAKYFTLKIQDRKIARFTLKQHIGFWITKVLYTFLFLVLPGIIVGWKTAFIGYGMMALVCGFVIAIVFQLAHLVEGTGFILLDGSNNNKAATCWQVHELATTSDFATDNKWVSWLLGGLNFQVEHHLFSKISHVHYAALNQIVRQTCGEYQVPYLENKSLWAAIKSHIRFLRKMGRPVPVVVAAPIPAAG